MYCIEFKINMQTMTILIYCFIWHLTKKLLKRKGSMFSIKSVFTMIFIQTLSNGILVGFFC